MKNFLIIMLVLIISVFFYHFNKIDKFDENNHFDIGVDYANSSLLDKEGKNS